MGQIYFAHETGSPKSKETKTYKVISSLLLFSLNYATPSVSKTREVKKKKKKKKP